jgi:hypothetical protein
MKKDLKTNLETIDDLLISGQNGFNEIITKSQSYLPEIDKLTKMTPILIKLASDTVSIHKFIVSKQTSSNPITKKKKKPSKIVELKLKSPLDLEKHKLPQIGDIFKFTQGFRDYFFATVSKITKSSVGFTKLGVKKIESHKSVDGHFGTDTFIPDQNVLCDNFYARKTSFNEEGFVKCSYEGSFGVLWDKAPIKVNWDVLD